MSILDWLGNIWKAIFGKAPDAPSWQSLLPTAPRTFFGGANNLVFSNSPDRNLRDAWNLAELSILAYWNTSGIKAIASQLDQSQWTLTPFVHGIAVNSEAGPVQAVLASSADTAILAFRGTRLNGFPGIAEILQLTAKPAINLDDLDLDLSFVLDPDGVHSGIHAAFNNWLGEFRGNVEGSLQGKRRVYVTGHSLGAALAGLAACTWQGLGNVSLYTFGCPRFCSEPYRTGYGAGLPVFRFVYGSDFVTSVPPVLLPPAVDLLPPAKRYTHVGDILCLDGNGTVTPGGHQPDIADVFTEILAETPLSWKLAADGLLRVFKSGRPFNPRIPASALTDHAPRNYADAMKRACGF